MINIKHFPFHLILSFTFGSAFILCQASLPAQAQKGNQSDVTGASVTTSDIAGGTFAPSPAGGRGQVAFTSSTDQVIVNQAAVKLLNQLITITLTSSVDSSIPSGTQQNLLSVLTASGSLQANASIGFTSALSSSVQGGPTVKQAQQLVNSLKGLLKTNPATANPSSRQVSNVKVNPTRLVAAVKAYNDLINASSAQFLNNPPPELLAIRSVLSQLINSLS